MHLSDSQIKEIKNIGIVSFDKMDVLYNYSIQNDNFNSLTHAVEYIENIELFFFKINDKLSFREIFYNGIAKALNILHKEFINPNHNDVTNLLKILKKGLLLLGLSICDENCKYNNDYRMKLVNDTFLIIKNYEHHYNDFVVELLCQKYHKQQILYESDIMGHYADKIFNNKKSNLFL